MTVSEAAASGDTAQLRTLLEAGGDPNESETEDPPLIEATYANHVEAARLLLDWGADMYRPNSGGETALLVAAQRGSIEVFRLLVERGYRFDAVRENLPWMFTQVAGSGYLEVVQWLLSQNVDVNLTDYRGLSALTHAAKNDQTEVVEELLRAGANPSHCDDDTETVLMWAADHAGNAAVLRLLIQAGADVNALNDMQATALSWCMDHGDPDMIHALLDAGVVIRPNDLTRAAYRGHLPAVRLLLEYGADATDLGDLEIAGNRGHREVANLLRQAATDQQLRQRGGNYPPPQYAVGTHVRTLTGTPREGWIVHIEWNHKHGRYGYHIEVSAKTQARKTVKNRYWEEELEVIP